MWFAQFNLQNSHVAHSILVKMQQECTDYLVALFRFQKRYWQNIYSCKRSANPYNCTEL